MPRRFATGPAAHADAPQPVPVVVRVAVVDHREMVRLGFGMQLQHIGGYALVLAVATGEELLAGLRAGAAVDVALVHVRGEGLDGLATLGLLHHHHPHLRTLALCEVADEELTLRAVRAEALGVLLADAGVEELRHALADACAGRVHGNALVKRALLVRARRDGPQRTPLLSRREFEVLCWAAHQARYTLPAIAHHMRLKLSTVKTHMNAVRHKLRARTYSEAMRRGRKIGLLPEVPTNARVLRW
ncbi:MAG: response regulator transcription factor [Flavobacteriales bacterium]|nr:response regulator transcription factor [Flavobacteriales bacterium]